MWRRDKMRFHYGCPRSRLVRIVLLFLCIKTACMFGCREEPAMNKTVGERNTPDPLSDVVGKWRCPAKGWRMTEQGPAQFMLQLNQSGTIRFMTTVKGPDRGPSGEFSFEQSGLDGTYRVGGHTLTTVALGSQPVAFERKGDHLILTFPGRSADKPDEIMDFARDVDADTEQSRGEKKRPESDMGAKKKTDDAAARIVGRWRSPPKGWDPGEWGPSQVVIEFSPSKRIRVRFTINHDPAPAHAGEFSVSILGMEGVRRPRTGGFLAGAE
jgi:hypothetical protein